MYTLSRYTKSRLNIVFDGGRETSAPRVSYSDLRDQVKDDPNPQERFASIVTDLTQRIAAESQPRQKERLQSVLDRLNADREKILAASRASLESERGRTSVESQQKALVAYFGRENLPAFMQDIHRLNIASFFTMLGQNAEKLASGTSFTKKQFEDMGYRSNGQFGGMEHSTLQQAVQSWASAYRTEGTDGKLHQLVEAYRTGHTVNDLVRIQYNLDHGNPVSYSQGRLTQSDLQQLVLSGNAVQRMGQVDNWNAIAAAHGSVGVDINPQNPMASLEAESKKIEQEIQRKYKDLKDGAAGNAQLLAELNKHDEAFWTGRIRQVATGAFANFDRNNGVSGSAGMTFEAFVRGLTLSIGAIQDGGKVAPGVVLHFNALSRTSADRRQGISMGAGAVLAPIVLPFADMTAWRADKVDAMNPNTPTVQGLSLMAGPGAQTLLYSRTRSETNLFEQMEAQLQQKVTEIAGLKFSDINPANPPAGLNTYWAERIKAVYTQAGVTDATPEHAKVLLLNGLVQSEIEKLQVATANNERESRSFRGGAVGVGNILGITFPLAGLTWGRYNVEYRARTRPQVATQPATATPVAPATPIEMSAESEVATLERFNQELDRFKLEIYRGSEQKGSAFDKVLQAISSREYSSALDQLKAQPNNRLFKKLITFLEAPGLTPTQQESRFRAVLSYVYGSPLTMNAKNVDTRTFTRTRTDRIRSAEAIQLGISVGDLTSEALFNTEAHTPKQLSAFDELKGQRLSTAVVSTSKRATHRIDVYPGSIEVSDNHIQNITNQAVIGRLADQQSFKADIKAQHEYVLKSLNLTSEQFSLAQYTEYLKTGDVSKLPQGVSVLAAVKWYEARAMISGSNCLNLAYTLAYPRFSGMPVTPAQNGAGTITPRDLVAFDRTVTIGASAVTTGRKQEGNAVSTKPTPDGDGAKTQTAVDGKTSSTSGGQNINTGHTNGGTAGKVNTGTNVVNSGRPGPGVIPPTPQVPTVGPVNTPTPVAQMGPDVSTGRILSTDTTAFAGQTQTGSDTK